jgi:hypothetical protein
MPDKLPPDHIAYEKLSEKHLDAIKTFENQETDSVDFLREDALGNQERGLSVTYLFFYLDGDTMPFVPAYKRIAKVVR